MISSVSNETRFLHVVEMGLGAWQWGDRVVWQYGRGYNDKDIQQAFQVSVLSIPLKFMAQGVPNVSRVNSSKRLSSPFWWQPNFFHFPGA